MQNLIVYLCIAVALIAACRMIWRAISNQKTPCQGCPFAGDGQAKCCKHNAEPQANCKK